MRQHAEDLCIDHTRGTRQTPQTRTSRPSPRASHVAHHASNTRLRHTVAVRPLPSGFVTFMFTDVVGSTRLHQELGAQYVELIETHNRLLNDIAEAHDGRVVKALGD